MPENKKRFLRNVTVNFISLVDKGANQKTIIYKAHQDSNTPDSLHKENNFIKAISISKVDNDQRLVYGIVYSPDDPDTEGDYTSAEVIKQMAYDFMKNRNTNNIDQQHNYVPDEGFVAESWILEKNDPHFPDEPEGSWAVAIKVTKEETWEKVKSGEITGLSMAGFAEVETLQKNTGSFIERLLKATGLKKSLKDICLLINDIVTHLENEQTTKINNQEKKNGENNMTPDQIQKAIEDALRPISEKLDMLEKENKNLSAAIAKMDVLEKSSQEISSLSKELTGRLEKLEKATPGSAQLITTEEIFKKDKDYKGPNWLG